MASFFRLFQRGGESEKSPFRAEFANLTSTHEARFETESAHRSTTRNWPCRMSMWIRRPLQASQHSKPKHAKQTNDTPSLPSRAQELKPYQYARGPLRDRERSPKHYEELAMPDEYVDSTTIASKPAQQTEARKTNE